MADDGDGPDFSYAFAGASASWNPALRPDHLSPQKTSFSQSDTNELPQAGNDDDLPSRTSHFSPESWTSKPHLMDKEPTSDDDFFDRYGAPEAPPMSILEAPALEPHAQHNNVHEAWKAIRQEPTAEPVDESNEALHMEEEEQKEHPPTELPIPAESTIDNDLEGSDSEQHGTSEIEHPEMSYEHQATTTLDDAVQEDAETSLVAAAETPAVDTPSVEWGAGGDDWDLGGTDEPIPQVGDVQCATLEATEPAGLFQTQDDDVPEQSEISPEPAMIQTKEVEVDWGTSNNVDFGLGATSKSHVEESPEESLAQPVQPPAESNSKAPEAELGWGNSEDVDFGLSATSEGEAFPDLQETAPQGDADLAAIWGAELEDDELLPDDAAAAFAFEDDGEGFLEDKSGQQKPGLSSLDTSVSQPTRASHGRTSSINYTPPGLEKELPPNPGNPYLPTNPQFTDLSPRSRTQVSNRGLPAASPYQAAYQPPQPIRPQLQAGESFADKAKGGYHSPYDLPEDLNIGRRRPIQPKASTPTIQQSVQPPPRLSSMRSMSALAPPSSLMSARNFTPPTSSHSVQPPNGSFGEPSPVQPKVVQRPSSEMFAELPMSQKPLRRGTPGRYTPQTENSTPPLGIIQPPINRGASYSMPPQAQSQHMAPLAASQLQTPARLPPYAEEPNQTAHPALPAAPPASLRYSPAVAQGPGVSPSTSFPVPAPPFASNSAPPSGPSRYSPAPTSQPQAPPPNSKYVSQPPPPARAQSQQFAPRTSSPLAHHSTQQEHFRLSMSPSDGTDGYPTDGSHGRPSFDRGINVAPQPFLETLAEDEPYAGAQLSHPDPSQYGTARSATPPQAARSGPPSSVSSPRKRANYAPQNYQPMAPSAEPGFAPPRRSQTSSPGAVLKHPRLAMANIDRPASAHGQLSPTMAITLPVRAQTMPRQPAYDEANLAWPQDERVNDPLQRWRGVPIFRWGIGNSVVTSFPKYVPRYGGGQTGPPMIKPTQDFVRTRNTTDIYPHAETFAKFPGPLKKGKKKEILTWLKSTTESLEQANQLMVLNGMLPAAVYKQREEKLLLWKVMALVIEHDGVLEGVPAIEEAVRKLISPTTTEETTADAFGATQAPTNALPEAFDPNAVNVLRNQLYKGEREKAVWHAADQRLWAHALLIASTLNNKDVWKRVVQEFVHKEIRKIGDNTEALAALYQVFAGNWEESIDELVSSSARAGFNFVSTTSTPGAQKDALAGLDRWRETLLLILNNRSAGDAQALVALGKLLSGYGRIEAAHVCFLFAKNAIFSGADDPQAHFSLVGGAPSTQGSDFGTDLDTILLTEVYEFSLTTGPTPHPPVPHLQAYKLFHAEVLAEMGRRSEAQQYCDAIAAIITAKSNKTRTPYYNAQLINWVNELNQRLSQAPLDSSSSWKPSMDKVSTSLWGKFNNFIAGEDSDANTNDSKNQAQGADPGQFARLAGETPPLSRAASNIDMYSAYHPNGSTATHSIPPQQTKYPPPSAYAPRSSQDQQRPSYNPQFQSAYQPRTSGESARSAYEPQPRQSLETPLSSSPQRASSFNTYAPTNAFSGPYAAQAQGTGLQPSPQIFSPQSSEVNLGTSPYSHSPQNQPTPPNEPASYHSPPIEQQQSYGYEPPPAPQQSFDSPSQSLDSQQHEQQQKSSGYEAPSSGYEPPSYQPYEPEDNPWTGEESDSPARDKPKKKSFMDDDDDDELIRRAAQLKNATPAAASAGTSTKGKSEADRLADEAFRKAAEADAEKTRPPAQQRGSWLGSWFKKDPNAPQTGPIKAKLGEESSFVYDTDLKKWVNKKAGAEATNTPTAATPPPPKASGPPSRPSSSMAPAGPARTYTPPLNSAASSPGMPGPGVGSLAPPIGGGMPPMARSASSPMPPSGSNSGGPPSRPPSRPASSLSTASDIGDLIGNAAPRRPGQKKAPRKGRYVDVMANQK